MCIGDQKHHDLAPPPKGKTKRCLPHGMALSGGTWIGSKRHRLGKIELGLQAPDHMSTWKPGDGSAGIGDFTTAW